MTPAGRTLGLAAATAAIIAAVVTGLFVVGSPGEERARRLDGRRVTDLQGIARATDLFWTRHARLPASLDELAAEPGVLIRTSDPAGLEDYGYQPVDTVRYELCATFERASEDRTGIRARAVWAHGAGRQCLPLEADAIDRNETERMFRPGAAEPPPIGRREDPGG